ncbi:MAG: Stk1 family PASTA domain-containing Ser/Thr kinase [Saccharofermentanales bacterium]
MKGFLQVGNDDAKISSDPAADGRQETTGDISASSGNGEVEIGTTVGNRYRIIRLLGKGGMADVYLAADMQKNKEVAVKVLRRELTNDEEFIRRFDTEARAASSLSYPNIVKVFDVGIDGNLRYMVMEYVNGISLKELIIKNGCLDWEVALPIAIQVGLALENAHKNGIIHRDIKPHNIMITPDFIAKVADFGIARAASANTVTLTGNKAVGSVHYFSPEQARGGIVGEQSDIYSMGILLYEMLTGKLPFNGDTSVSIALKHIQELPVPPMEINPRIPKGLNDIILKCIQKSSENRYSKARNLVDELDAFMIDPGGSYGYVEHPDERAETTRITALRREPNFSKLREIEASKTKRKKVRMRETIIIAISLLITAGILYQATVFAIGFVKKAISNPVAEYTVENYVGSKVEDVKSKLEEANIKYEVFYEQNETVSSGLVFFQSVPKGLSMRPGGASAITLKVSSGKDTVRLGDYSGKNYKLAESELTQVLGLKVTITKELSGEMPRDNVIETIPGPGNDVPRGGEVTLVVSDGLINVTVPAILGMSRADALLLLEENFLKVASEALLGSDPNLPEDKQFIIGCDPAPGTDVKALTGVLITLGSYEDYLHLILPEVTATPSPSPTPIPSPTPVISTASTASVASSVSEASSSNG